MNEATGNNIMIVDDSVENLRILCAILGKRGFISRPLTSGKLAIEASIAEAPDLVLMDILMPDMSGLDVCRWFKKDERFKNIPIIFISGLLDIDGKVEAFRVGASDFISKPFTEEEVMARITTHLRLSHLNVDLVSHTHVLEKVITENTKILMLSQLATIFALAKLAETRDDDTGHHIERVQTFSKALAQRMRMMKFGLDVLTDDYIDTIFQTASLHDIGKVGTPDAILLKTGTLNAEEFTEMKKHCELGSNTLAQVLVRFPDNQFLRMGVDVSRSHHENWDGSGYPDGLKGKDIPLAARIVSLADFYDALTSKRCYRDAFEHSKTCQMIIEANGKKFDPDIVDAFFLIQDDFKRIRTSMQDLL